MDILLHFYVIDVTRTAELEKKKEKKNQVKQFKQHRQPENSKKIDFCLEEHVLSEKNFG